MREMDKLTQIIRSQSKALQALLVYMESQGNWTKEDVSFCRHTLRRVARELISASRGRLGELEIPFLIHG
ncbi:MAG: hypothetical protein NC910_00025 [Candidatus Omnitrophica bacterium]|nr:hypothetical protein [Candidatus Omnitrophota bacterium]